MRRLLIELCCFQVFDIFIIFPLKSYLDQWQQWVTAISNVKKEWQHKEKKSLGAMQGTMFLNKTGKWKEGDGW